jgi:NTE family protein
VGSLGRLLRAYGSHSLSRAKSSEAREASAERVRILTATFLFMPTRATELPRTLRDRIGHEFPASTAADEGEDHWRAGYHDGLRTLRNPEVLARPTRLDGVFTFDLERDGRE